MRGSAALRTGATPGGALAGPWVRNPLWTRARAVPSLDLCFADTKSLVCATTGQNLVTHTRASSGTFVGSDGVLRSAVTNLVLQSEDFGTTWTPFRASVSANTTAAPNGSMTADKIVEDTTATNSHGVQQLSLSFTSGTSYTFSVYVKAAERANIRIALPATAFTLALVAQFNLTLATTTALTAGATATISALPDGWYRCAVTAIATATATGGVSVSMGETSASTTINYTGNGTSGLFLWGAQLEQSATVGEYIPTTSAINSAPRFDHNPTTGESLGLLVEEARTNLTLNSEDFSAATWTLISSTITANATASPTGTTTADLLLETTANSVHNVYATNPHTFTTATHSIYVKPNGRTNVALRFYHANADWVSTVFSLTGSGSVTQSSAGLSSGFSAVSSSIVDAGNGWYRLSMTATQVSRGTIAAVLDLCSSSTPTLVLLSGAESYSGDITKGVYAWGSQLEAGAFPTSYIPTTSATVTRAADVASITGSNFGTTRTNLLVRSEEFENASWTVISGAKTVTPNTTVAPNGTLTADTVTANGTSGTGHFVDQTVTLTAIPHAFTVYAKAGTNNFIQLRFSSALGNRHANFNVSTGATGTSGNITSSSVEPVGNGWYRCSMVCTPTAATGTLAIIVVSSNSAISGETNALNTSVILWGAQLETSSAVTPYIPSTTTFTSRASGASYFDAAGVLQWKPQNLLVRSEEFDNTGTWSRSGLSAVTANATVAPDGLTNADALVEDASTGTHRVFAVPASLLASTPYSLSVYVKASTRNIVRVEVRDSVGAFSAQDFDLTTQAITSAGSGTGTISSVGNGWFRCTVNGTSSVSGGVGAVLIYSMQAVGNANYTGTNGTSAILIWGAQLEQRAGSFAVPGEYTPTVATATGGARNSAFLPDSSGVFRSAGSLLLEDARTNIVSNSEDFGGAPWSLGDITVTANAAVSPTGATTADSLLETTVNTEHTVYVTSPQTFTTATQSFYVKPNGRTNVALRFYHTVDDWVSTVFSLTGNGSVTQSSAGSSSGFSAVSSSITNAGNGWYRISMTGTQTSRGTYGAVFNLCTSSTPTLGTSNGSEVYAGDITKGVYVWGAQLEAASTASSYIPTTTATATRAADISTSVATSVFESSWYNQTEGTMYSETNWTFTHTATVPSGISSTWEINNTATSTNNYCILGNSATTADQSQGRNPTIGLNRPSISGFGFKQAGVLYKTAFGWNPSVLQHSTNNLLSSAPANTVAALMATHDRMLIGQASGGVPPYQLNGTIKRLVYWGQRLPNLQAITQ